MYPIQLSASLLKKTSKKKASKQAVAIGQLWCNVICNYEKK